MPFASASAIPSPETATLAVKNGTRIARMP
jgi:hypothetical protein